MVSVLRWSCPNSRCSLKTVVAILSLLIFTAGYSRADNIPSAELQTRIISELGLEYEPRNPQREAPGYWHFYGNGLSVYVPEGSSFDQIKTLAIAKLSP
jgi:hypothetical protein